MYAPSPDTESGCRFEAKALYKGHSIGFAVALGTAWEAQEVGENSSKFLFYWGEADLISLAAESDAFIQTLDQLYQSGSGATHLRPGGGQPARQIVFPARPSSL
jgi:hypothetical protein